MPPLNSKRWKTREEGCTTDKLTVALFSPPLPHMAAADLGYFARLGLDIRTVQVTGSVQQMSGLLAGEYDLAYTAIDNVIAYDEKGQGESFAFAGMDHGSLSLWALPEVGAVSDLCNREIAVDAPDTGFAFVLKAILEAHGLANQQYQLVSVGGTRERFAKMQEGKVVASLMTPPFDDMARGEGFRQLARATDNVPGYLGVVAATTRKIATVRTQKLVDFTDALLQGMDWVLEPSHLQSLAGIVSSAQGVSPETAERRCKNELHPESGLIPGCVLAPESLSVVLSLRRRMSSMPPQRQAKDYIDNSFLEEARKRRE